MYTIQVLRLTLPKLIPLLDEEQIRLVLGAIALFPDVTISVLAEISNKSRTTIYKGKEQLCSAQEIKDLEASFHNGASVKATSQTQHTTASMGAPSTEVKYPGFMNMLRNVVEPFTYVEDGVTYVNASSRFIANELSKRSIIVSHATVDNKLHEIGMKCKKCNSRQPARTSVYAIIEKRFLKNGIQAFEYITFIVKYGELGEIFFCYASVLNVIVLETKNSTLPVAEIQGVVTLALPTAEDLRSQRINRARKRHSNSMNCVIQIGEHLLALPSTDDYSIQRIKAAHVSDKRQDCMVISLSDGRNILALPEGYCDVRTRQAHDRHKNPRTKKAIPQPGSPVFLALPQIEEKRALRIASACSSHPNPKTDQAIPMPPAPELLALPQIEEKRALRIKNAYARHKVEDDKNPIIIPPLYLLFEVIATIRIIVDSLKSIFGKKLKVKVKVKRSIRKKGGGRYKIECKYPILDYVLFFLVDNYIFGDPEKETYWCAISLKRLRVVLEEYGIYVSTKTINKHLKGMGISLKRNKKMEQDGEKHPDADRQMEYIKNKLEEYKKSGYCVISIDCKNKENVGNYDNGKKSYCLTAPTVKTHDFCNDKVAPYGIYDINKNSGYINLGISKDTAEFAVNSIRKWWLEQGCKDYPNLRVLVITADGGGSNSYRVRLFKRELQKFANETNLKIIVHHYPRGKSKYNKIEHRLFCHISNNWRDVTLKTVDIILNRIRNTRTLKGLTVEASLDTREYKTGIKISKKELEKELLIDRDVFHGEWNYSLYPESRRDEYKKMLQNNTEVTSAA